MSGLFALNKALRAHDVDLYARRLDNGVTCVFRKAKVWESFEFDGALFQNLKNEEQLVCSLTDTWGLQGKATDWGIEPVLAHIKAIDLFNNDDVFERILKENEKAAESKQRAFRNSTESFLLDFHDDMRRTFKDVRWANLDMSKDARRKYEKRRLNHGHR